jgi:hypothetical protein
MVGSGLPACGDSGAQGDTLTGQADTFVGKVTFAPWTLFHVFQVP